MWFSLVWFETRLQDAQAGFKLIVIFLLQHLAICFNLQMGLYHTQLLFID